MTDKPTRIVAPPFLRRATNPGGGHTQPMTCVICDDGRTYPLHELAAAVGLTKKTLLGRLATIGWNHHGMLHPGRLTLSVTGASRDEPGCRRRTARKSTPAAPMQPVPVPAAPPEPAVVCAKADTPRPTRIISPPTRGRKTNRIGRPKVLDLLRCDNGQTYTVAELAQLIGISQEAFRARITTSGWDHPNILGGPVPKGLALDGTKKNSSSEGNEEWQRLSTKSRTRRLAQFARPGVFERTIGG